jgi:hypothetical protein
MLGRGLVQPLDQHHSANPPSQPEVLDLLAREFVAHGFDVKWLVRELALTETYARSSHWTEGMMPAPETFLAASERRLSGEQLWASVCVATGPCDGAVTEIHGKRSAKLEQERERFIKALANPPTEPEEDFIPSLRAALFVLNDAVVLDRLKPAAENLADRLLKAANDDALASELYLAVLSRPATSDERKMTADYLQKNAARRAVAVGHLVWALLASTEFCLNH